MSSKYKPIIWRDASESLPKVDKKLSKVYGREISKLVLVHWEWEKVGNYRREETVPRPARRWSYTDGSWLWLIEGISGNTKVISWAYLTKPKLRAPKK